MSDTRRQLDAADRENIDAKGGQVAEKAKECRSCGGDRSQPRAPVLERQPQAETDKRGAEPEQIIEKSPQKTAIVQQQKRGERPQPPPAGGDSIEIHGAARDQ